MGEVLRRALRHGWSALQQRGAVAPRAVDVLAEMGVDVTVDDFVPFMGTGEANFLGGVARVKGVKDFNPQSAKKRFFEIYLDKYAKPNSGIGFPGALELIMECKNAGLKVAVASSANRVKMDANLAAVGLPVSLDEKGVPVDATNFRRIIGSLRYLTHTAGLGVLGGDAEQVHGGTQGISSSCSQAGPEIRERN